jgi:hypothetical protein
MLTLLAIVLTAILPPDSTWRDHRRAARAAAEAKNYTALHEQLLVLLDSLSGNPGVVYNLAATEARLGQADGALKWLRRYAAMGMALDPTADSDFASLRGTPAFDSVTARIAANRRPVSRASAHRSLPADGLITEDVAYDPQSKRLFVSSVRQRKVLVIDASGATSEFLKSGQDSLWGVFALAVDPGRHRLWVTTAALPQSVGVDTSQYGRSGVRAYDLRSGTRVARIDLPIDKASHALGDMTLMPNGDALISDGLTGTLYRARAGATALETVVDTGVLASPQTPAMASDGRSAYVADYTRGLAMVDLASHRVRWLSHPDECAMAGIDGLTRVGRDLIAVQNGTTPIRIERFTLTPDGRSIAACETLEQETPGLGEPTHGVMVDGNYLFIVNSGWGRLDDDGQLRADAPPDAPAIWKLRP